MNICLKGLLGTAVAVVATCSQAQFSVASFEWLGTLGGTESFAFGVNSFGKTTGWSLNSSLATRAFFYDSAMSSLPLLAGWNSAEGHDINDQDWIVGSASTAAGTVSFMYQLGTPTELTGISGATDMTAWGLNSAGTVVGSATFASGDRAFIHSGGIGQILGPLPGGNTRYAGDINDSGWIAGSGIVSTDIGPRERAFRYNGTDYEIVPIVDGYASAVGKRLNAAGDEVGFMKSLDAVTTHAFFYGSGGLVEISTFGGLVSVANGISEKGFVVGSAKKADKFDRAFIWDAGTLTDLNVLVSSYLAPGSSLKDAQDIQGNWIVGNGYNSVSKRNEGWRIQLVPEPMAVIAFAIGLMGALRRRQRERR